MKTRKFLSATVLGATLFLASSCSDDSVTPIAPSGSRTTTDTVIQQNRDNTVDEKPGQVVPIENRDTI